MNVKQLIAAAAVFAATGSAFAAAEYTPPAEGFVSTKSRAEVVSELNQAKASGSYAAAGNEEYAGQYAALAGKSSPQALATGKSRDEVAQELKQAQAAGQYVTGGEEYAGQHIVPASATGYARNGRQVRPIEG